MEDKGTARIGVSAWLGVESSPTSLQGCQRRLLRRLEDHGVSARQGRRQLPGSDVQGKVPGNDRADHAHRLAERVVQEGARDRDHVSRELVGPAREVTEVGYDEGQVDPGGLERGLAVVPGLHGCDEVEVLLDQVCQSPEKGRPPVRIEIPPGRVLERRARRAHRRIDFGGSGLLHLRDDFLDRRVHGGEAITSVPPLTADQKLRTQLHDFLSGDAAFTNGEPAPDPAMRLRVGTGSDQVPVNTGDRFSM